MKMLLLPLRECSFFFFQFQRLTAWYIVLQQDDPPYRVVRMTSGQDGGLFDSSTKDCLNPTVIFVFCCILFVKRLSSTCYHLMNSHYSYGCDQF